MNRAVALTASALLAATALTACGSSDHGAHPGGAPASAAATGAAGRAGDVAFAQSMIPHHEQAVEMADLALDKQGVSAEVKRLATAIKGAQDPEIRTMTGWLSEWGAPTMSDDHAGHDMAGMMSEADMTSLAAASGAEFDRMWLTMMVAHHEGAVTMAQAVLATTTDPRVRTLAEAVVSAQREEIATMKKLLA